ncbi:hypothetical protein POX_a01076 [Penicillium oxalicum]|uniref:hypothetical protein n=1 Tax=Penicillium oxalicum TaxID=69781 RepID=UPI0020B8EDCC|nr:hypothetical protein POX_a01076 [Penicillium oxalicum]KAI2794477.1 hypothetical protein POX_a01076 [Penicillium oxalicum]
MGVLRTAALVVLGISAFVFVALFGRLPIFSIAWIDSRVFGGRIVQAWNRSGNYILHANHPLVLIFFIGLLSIGECAFVPAAWPRISNAQHLLVVGVIIAPYLLIYKCVTTKSYITADNHELEMKRYPYDGVLFHPGHVCSTCDFIKPARSKHCSLCQACISRHDHHCVWLMNCVGAENYKYFLSLLLSLSILLVYGTLLGYSLLLQTMKEIIPPELQEAMKAWSMYFHIWSIVITRDAQIGTVTLLMVMTAPLAIAFLVYHTYLIWAGMTTNESAKWVDWKEDILDGFVFKANRSQIENAPQQVDLGDRPWPVKSSQVLVTDDQPPLEGFVFEEGSNRVHYPGEAIQPRSIDSRWTELQHVKDLDNIYDLGFKRNLVDALDNKPLCTPPELMLKVILAGTLSHYETRGMIDDKRLEHMLAAGKQILYKTHQESELERHNLGMSPDVWAAGLTDVLTKAIPVLESQSFAWKSPRAALEHSSSNLIAYNYFSLVKDIERLNDLCTIARNLLATTKKAQNLAAEKGFDQRILALIDTCSAGKKVVNLYKRLLITCLQYLHNFIMHNEHRKMVLWLDLFGYHSTADTNIIQPKEALDSTARTEGVAPIVKIGERVINPPIRALYDQTAEDLLLETIAKFPREPSTIKEEAAMLLLANIKDHMEKILGRDLTDIQEMGRDPEQVKYIRAALTSILGAKVDGWADLQERARELPPALPEDDEQETTKKKTILTIDRSLTAGFPRLCWADLPEVNDYSVDSPVTEDDTSLPRSSQSAAETLQEAKDELMARLQEASQMGDEGAEYDHGDSGTVGEDDAHSLEGHADGSVDEDEEEEDDIDRGDDGGEVDDDEDDDDYRGRPGDQQRGLLTDIPLVLGPAEIEALPMIVQAGIVESFGLKNGERNGSRNMQALRCHILLTQETGRNLLRELLIFIAAWDLPDDELYFKMMVQIMEAVLRNGLMSHAYSDFGQPKDIISPAQAVVIKILTHIFRAKYSPASVTGSAQGSVPRMPSPLSRVDVLTVRYIFTIFRGNIIPETCALIYLQGQIRADRALPEDFPLNLWDMERVYEGVYQFLEFFAVLTENNDWKNLLVKWEIVYDLVTLIKELEASIPKGQLSALSFGSVPPPPPPPARSASPNHHSNSKPASPTPVAVERPYDPSDPADPLDSHAGSVDSRPESPPIAEDPSEFEWRNLKKLVVLVLSSLVWKCPEVQEQIRRYGGVEAILMCTSFDSNNPYIKEHAVMCLKFLLEGNRENQRLVEELEAREVVRDDGGVLERSGYEAMIDQAGKLAIRPKDASQASSS